MTDVPASPAPRSVVLSFVQRLFGVAVCVLVYFAACASPALTFVKGKEEYETWLGGEALLMGWWGIPSGHHAWLANLPLFLAWALMLGRAPLPAVPLAAISIYLSFATSSLAGATFPDNLSGGRMLFVELGIGCQIWRASMLVTAIVAVIIFLRTRAVRARHATLANHPSPSETTGQ